jgi:hypothetical protein
MGGAGSVTALDAFRCAPDKMAVKVFGARPQLASGNLIESYFKADRVKNQSSELGGELAEIEPALNWALTSRNADSDDAKRRESAPRDVRVSPRMLLPSTCTLRSRSAALGGRPHPRRMDPGTRFLPQQSRQRRKFYVSRGMCVMAVGSRDGGTNQGRVVKAV